MKKEEIIF